MQMLLLLLRDFRAPSTSRLVGTIELCLPPTNDSQGVRALLHREPTAVGGLKLPVWLSAGQGILQGQSGQLAGIQQTCAMLIGQAK